MPSANSGLAQTATSKHADLLAELDDSLDRQAAMSTALTSVFRGKFCDLIVPNRKPTTFDKQAVIYDVGDRGRTFFFLQSGQRSGSLVEIPAYLTQEEIAQMAAARRERISTALNCLRRRGIVQYSMRGHMMLDIGALETYSA